MVLFRVSSWGMARGSYTITPSSKWTTALRPPYLLMVHGYNNTRGEANEKYVRLANQFDDCTTAGYYWENSGLYMHSRFLIKEGSASQLNFLCRNFSVEESRHLTIVGHSIGCRLILDCLTRLTQRADAPILRPKNLLLWSAAVDDDEICKGEAYYEGSRLPGAVWVVYSRRDDVLMKLYPSGDQSFALGYCGLDLNEGPIAQNVNLVDCTNTIDEHTKWWLSDEIVHMTRSIIETGAR